MNRMIMIDQGLNTNIYLGKNRRLLETSSLQSYLVMDPDINGSQMSQPFGQIRSWEDALLLPGQVYIFKGVEEASLIVIPLTGNIANPLKPTEIIKVGELLLFPVQIGEEISIVNPDDEKPVNLLLLKCTPLTLSQCVVMKIPGEENEQYPSQIKILIGEFEERKEYEYKVKRKSRNIFAYVLSGAFEVNNCLLSARDGLAISRTKLLEMEALSNDAIILVVEMTEL
ncbi:hypothetical protein KZP23_18015 [Echinicola marina]|uniref:pirin family protein n=1 Tax=Echinicola marina TaxID=2859768 RepID=UPI001CF648C0|nr:hypothetical protein [Echinicola marina]UCS92569.1 hypothetical protein KZP23_18015 [Echinicola marina]